MNLRNRLSKLESKTKVSSKKIVILIGDEPAPTGDDITVIHIVEDDCVS